ncbi:MAG: Bax inhibitor-1/YccA family protein [Flavobacteriaceae bacterium]|nr:Bax inhibitor-1/YccA family protein [Flavobacteriaceae bacterium]
MDNNIQFSQAGQQQQTGAVSKTFLSSVFSWMATALGISGIIAYLFGTDASLLSYLVSDTGMTGLGYFVLFAPIGLVIVMSWARERLSFTAMTGLFLVYAVMMGMSLSFIFIIYSMGSIASVFAISAGMFGVMAVLGYTTNTDLTKLGTLLMMALIGIIIASVVNAFMHSSQMSYIISFISVIVFTGLTAYDVQKLKNMGAQVEYGTESTAKLAILGALTLYLDFINLFLALLRMFGSRD